MYLSRAKMEKQLFLSGQYEPSAAYNYRSESYFENI